jgi:hypothetical protein
MGAFWKSLTLCWEPVECWSKDESKLCLAYVEKEDGSTSEREWFLLRSDGA